MSLVAKEYENPYRTIESRLLRNARRLEELYREMNKVDDLDLYSEAVDIENSIAETPAGSVEEAAVQLMLVAGFLECLRTDEGIDPENLLENMERLTRSALSAVLRDTGIDLAEYGGERYVPKRTDPFLEARRPN